MHKIASIGLQLPKSPIWVSVVIASLLISSHCPAIAQDQACKNSYKASPIWSPDNTSIAFGWVCDEQSDIWLIEPDGNSLTNLTANIEGFSRGMDWSPDGKQISFISERNGELNIWVMNKNGSNPVNLTSNMEMAFFGNPRWSPDGINIAFEASKSRSGRPRIWVMAADGSGLQQLTPDDDYAYVLPSWSPDSQHLVFARTKQGVSQLWVANNDGSGMTRITPIDFYALNVQWSPVDNQIVTANVDGLWITDSLGTDLVNVSGEQNGFLPVWSPNGKSIVFQVSTKEFDIWHVMSDGSNPRNLTQDLTGDSVSPSWSPDARKIAFVFYNGESQEIWSMDADGSNPINLTGERH